MSPRAQVRVDELARPSTGTPGVNTPPLSYQRLRPEKRKPRGWIQTPVKHVFVIPNPNPDPNPKKFINNKK